ncbi:hypothetical protein TrST_g12332 [Triparma strigata]|uniref:Transmembrane protein n=1 Tax=Triparma strigata TaxID=1606541 RepID=A0A9W7E9A1_9STRA|nr:hypothetical protein TrST_g12332 [Triparma strigata]
MQKMRQELTKQYDGSPPSPPPAPSPFTGFRICSLVLILDFSIVFVAQKFVDEADAAFWTLGPLSVLTFAGWCLYGRVVYAAPYGDGDEYEIGADAGWVLIFVPLGFSAFWISTMIFTVLSRAILQQPVRTASLKWQGIAFVGVFFTGLFGALAVPAALKSLVGRR